MAQPAYILSQQTVQVNATSPDGANTLYITNGFASFALEVNATGTQFTTQQGTFAVLLGPTLTAAQFKRAIATASLAGLHYQAIDPVQATGLQWSLSNVEADFDDESGQIELRFDVSLKVAGAGTYAFTPSVAFQVTTLAMI